MERQTNFSGMLGIDKPEWQVRYSDGVRFTRPFGCPVRTLRNSSTVLRDWWGDGNGKGLDSIEDAGKSITLLIGGVILVVRMFAGSLSVHLVFAHHGMRVMHMNTTDETTVHRISEYITMENTLSI